MCGIIGIFSQKTVAGELYDGLIHLQHRGTDAAGMVTFDDRFHNKRGLGYIREVFDQNNASRLTGNWGIAHTRYTTSGSAGSKEEVQPFIANYPYGIALAHNGNIVNYAELKKKLNKKNYHCNSNSDTELLLGLMASKLAELNGNPEYDFFEKLCLTVKHIFKTARGGYSVVGIIANKGMFAFRDPNGIRPLVLGERKKENKTDFIFSSENTMHYSLDFKFAGNVKHGELIFIDQTGKINRKTIFQDKFTPCIFEYVYLARPDSYLNNISVYKSRLRMGENLAKKWKKIYPDVKPDVVVPVPFCSNTAGFAMAKELGVKYSEGLYKNQFVGRTFIMPGAELRKKSVLQKLSPQELEIKGRDVLLVDDSIVRGNTSKEVVKLIRDAGAKKIYFASASPPILHPDFYGIDIPTYEELIASQKTISEIRKFIGVDILLYQDAEDLVEAVLRKGNHCVYRPSMPYFDSWYPTESETKKILLIGSGGRENAIAKSLKKSKYKVKLYCFGSNKNPGILKLAEKIIIGNTNDTEQILKIAQKYQVDFVFVGPENPLEAGVADILNARNIPCVGPTKENALLETSKSFTRNLMLKYAIPGLPNFKVFSNMKGVKKFITELKENFVIKADGLMSGKGVKVFGEHLSNLTDALNFCEKIIEKQSKFVIEEKLFGPEFSLMAFSDGKNLSFMPPVQDHKRAYEGNQGPNTGGMGSYSMENHLLPFLTDKDLEQAKKITENIMQALREETKTAYKGIVYGGFMLTKDGVKVIEYNARFGDPESINVLSILKSDLTQFCIDIIAEKLNENKIEFEKKATVCKYAVPLGYPENPIKNQEIQTNETDEETVYYGSASEEKEKIIALGSRTVAILGISDTLEKAEEISEREINKIVGKIFHRKDIGKPAK